MTKRMDKGNATPVMRQFLTAKEAHPDALLFFRMGDFYELFYDDAVVAAKALDLTLTSRNKGAEEEIPMAGVPHHAASQYIQRLLEQGFKVALCEQMADPSKVKGIVPREVVRVVSPGIVFDEAGLDPRRNHYIVAVESSLGAHGVAALDLTTGELLVCEAPDEASAVGEIVRLDPRELLAGGDVAPLLKLLRGARPHLVIRSSKEGLEDGAARELLLQAVNDTQLDDTCPTPSTRRAAARCVEAARVSEAGRPLPRLRVVPYTLGDTLVMDEATQSHLELVRTLDGGEKGSLLHVIDTTVTAGGARLLRRRLLAPRTDVAEIRRRLDGVEMLVAQAGVREDLRRLLDEVADVERLSIKFAFERAAPRDFVALRRSLKILPQVSALLDGCPDGTLKDSFGLRAEEPWFAPCDDLVALLERAIVDDPPVRVSDGNVIRDGYDPELDEVRGLLRDGQRYMVELETQLKEQSQIGSLKLRYTRVFGWYIEVTRSHVGKAPSAWRRKQTVATGERFTCDELEVLAEKLASAEDRSSSREGDLFGALVKTIAQETGKLRGIAERLAVLDVTAALADVAHREDYVRPDVDDSTRLEVVDGRHPVVEKLAPGGQFVPNDVHLDAGEPEGSTERFWLVTGPNMAGKSTFMRQVALSVVLAQMGSFVPAKRARVGIVDRVLTRVGASDNLSKGDSTFMVEMKETANVLRRSTRRSLVVLDEIGRGTSTYDGLAIAWAVAEYLHDAVGCRTLFATHYHELTDIAEGRKGIVNYSVSAREHESDIIFLHKLQAGPASRSYGVACAKLAGLPEPVLARARVILADLEKGAALPSGSPASLRPRSASGKVQLDLFAPAAPERIVETHPALDALRSVDVHRLTPLDALTFVASLKKMMG